MAGKVLFVLPDFFAGGAQKVMISLAAGLDRARYDPAIIAVNGSGPWRERVPKRIPVTDLKRDNLRAGLPALLKALRGSKADIVVSTMGYLNLGVLLLKPWTGGHSRFIVREANALVPEGTGAFAAAVRKTAYRALYGRADCIVSPSERIADELAGSFDVDTSRLMIVRNPVDVDALRKSAVPLRRREGRGPRYVCVGRLSRQKAYARLLDTLAAHDLDGHVTILGEGPERGALEDRIASLDLGDRVTLAGFDPNPAPWVAGADALLLPSLWEGLPNVALEALALGTPVIAAPEAGAITEIAGLAETKAVSVVPMGRVFADAMMSVRTSSSAKLRASLLPTDFSPAAVNSCFQTVLEDVLEQA